MIHRLLKRNRPPSHQEAPERSAFSLGFSSSQSMDNTVEEIIREASKTEEETTPFDLPQPQPIINDPRFEIPDTTPKDGVFVKKTISKQKTFRGLSNPLKVPSYLQKNVESKPASSPIIKKTITTQSQSLDHLPQTSSFRLPITQSQSSIQQIRLSIGKELLKSAAACQMISIQEAHSMGGKLVLPPTSLLIPLLADLLHRNQDSVQKNLLQKIGKSPAPLDYFRSQTGNQSVQKFRSLLIPYKIAPVFYRGNSLTVLAEHPLLIPLAKAILQEHQFNISWIHCIPIELQELDGLE
ncbi:MAG: hypothetical protein V4507_02500 [Verrucomicrobiota bacterium]